MENKHIQLSKFLSFILRHDPQKYELGVDEEGFVSFSKLLEIINQQSHFGDVTAENIQTMIDSSDKKRFEIQGDKIRARYGHSFSHQVHYDPVTPPEFLFLGTAGRNIRFIQEKGINPVDRQYVHLSGNKEVAFKVGRRKTARPVVLIISAQKAHVNGIEFFNPEEGIYLTKKVPTEYIEFPKLESYPSRDRREKTGRSGQYSGKSYHSRTNTSGTRQNAASGTRYNAAPGNRQNTSPGNRQNTSPGNRQNTSPGNRQNTSPGSRQNTSPGSRQNTSPGSRQDNSAGRRPLSYR